jgi:YVTN family beta-propeller protein
MRLLAAVQLLVLTGCALQARPMTTPAPLEDDGEVYVYLRPAGGEATRLSFSLTGLSVTRAGTPERPLAIVSPDLTAAGARSERLVATGRVSPGDYTGLTLTVTRASLERPSGKSILRVSPDPVRVDFPFRVARRGAVVVSLGLDGAASIRGTDEFAPVFVPSVPARPSWQLAGFASNSGSTSLTAFDRRARSVTGVVPTGREPRGMALEPRGNRLYVATAGSDAVDIVDVAAGTVINRITMNGGDRPRDLALTPDGKLLVINSGSRSASFVDPVSTQELSRVVVGEEPWSLLLDRARQRAYVLNRRSNTISVVDVAARAVVGAYPTDPEPLWAQMNASGTRMYLICAGSAFLTVLSVPEMTLVKKVHVGLGASALKVDPRTDQIYLGKRDEGRVYVYEPSGFLAIDDFDVPDPVSHMAIDDVDNTLFALVPEQRKVVVYDLTSRNVTAIFEVGSDPYQVAVSGARY